MQRSKISQLPEEIKAELDHRIQSGGFANYSAVADWLTERCREAGIDPESVPSRSAVHAHGKKLEDIYSEILLEAERSRAFGAAFADQQNEYGKAVLRKALFRLDGLIEKVCEAVDTGEISSEAIARSVSPLLQATGQINRALVTVEKFGEELRAKVAAKFEELEAETKSNSPRRIDPETLRIIREEVYGLV